MPAPWGAPWGAPLTHGSQQLTGRAAGTGPASGGRHAARCRQRIAAWKADASASNSASFSGAIHSAAWPVTQPARLKCAPLRAYTGSSYDVRAQPSQQSSNQAGSWTDRSAQPRKQQARSTRARPQQERDTWQQSNQPKQQQPGGLNYDSQQEPMQQHQQRQQQRQQHRQPQQQSRGNTRDERQQPHQQEDVGREQQQWSKPQRQQQRPPAQARNGQSQQEQQQHIEKQQPWLDPVLVEDHQPAQSQQQRPQQQQQAWPRGGAAQQQQPEQGSTQHPRANQDQQRPQQQQRRPHQQQPQQARQQSQQGWNQPQSQQQAQHQRPPVQLFQGPPAGSQPYTIDPAAVAPMLTQRITRSTHWRQLEELQKEHGSSFNAIHVSAMLHTMSRLVGRKGVAGVVSAGQRKDMAALLEQLMQRSLETFKDHGKHELSSNAGALARLGYYREDYLATVTEASGHLLRDCSNQELANLAWALARLGHVPGDAWLESFQEETLTRMSNLNCVELGNTLWAHAKWAVQPPEQWLSAMFAALLARMVELQPPQLSSVLWALAMLKQRPPPELLDNLLLESQVKLAAFNSHGYATIAWSICRMDLRPRRQWLEDYVRHTHRAINAFETDQCFTNVSWALSKWEHKPPEPWLREFCKAVVPFMQRMPALGLSILVTSLADLRHNPPIEWTSFLLEEFHRKRRGTPATQTAAVLWAASRLLRSKQRDGEEYVGPGPGWVHQYAPLLQDLVDGMVPHLGSVPVPDLVDVTVGIADLNFFPGSAWMDAHETATNARLAELSAYQFGLLKAAYTKLDALFEASGGNEDDGEEQEDVDGVLDDGWSVAVSSSGGALSAGAEAALV